MKSIYEILDAASIEELDQLRDIILRADKWSTDDSIKSESIRNMGPRIYGSVLANEIRKFGGNSIANKVRDWVDDDPGVTYDVIVKDVADKVNASYRADASDEEIEGAIIAKLIGDIWDKLSEAERNALISECNPSGKAWMVGGSKAAIQTAFLSGGFESYKLLVIVVNAVVRQAVGVGLMSSGLSLATNAALTRTASIVLGPIGLVFTSIITAIQIAGPSYKVTVPSVLYIAYLRRKQAMAQWTWRGALSSAASFFLRIFRRLLRG